MRLSQVQLGSDQSIGSGWTIVHSVQWWVGREGFMLRPVHLRMYSIVTEYSLYANSQQDIIALRRKSSAVTKAVKENMDWGSEAHSLVVAPLCLQHHFYMWFLHWLIFWPNDKRAICFHVLLTCLPVIMLQRLCIYCLNVIISYCILFLKEEFTSVWEPVKWMIIKFWLC